MELRIVILCVAFLFTSSIAYANAESPVNDATQPSFLYKLVSPKDWELSQKAGHVVPSELDIESNFIHLSTEDQLAKTKAKFWENKEVIILKIETSKIQGHLVFESNPGGTTKYYHLYDGVIPLDAIREIEFSSKFH